MIQAILTMRKIDEQSDELSREASYAAVDRKLYHKIQRIRMARRKLMEKRLRF